MVQNISATKNRQKKLQYISTGHLVCDCFPLTVDDNNNNNKDLTTYSHNQ